MNQAKFEALINDSGLLNKETLSELEELLGVYPFCQTFHLLYAKNLHQQKHIRYNQQLKIAAAVVGDRTRLKHYIENTAFSVRNESEQQVTPVESSFVSINEHKGEVVEIPIIKESEIDSQVAELQMEEQTQGQTEPTPAEDLPVETIAQPDEDKSISLKSKEIDKTPETILSASLDATISREEKKKAIIALINKKFSERDVEKEALRIEKLTAENDFVVSPEKRNEEILSAKEEDTVDLKTSGDIDPDLSAQSTPEPDLMVYIQPETINLDYLEGFSVNKDAEFSEKQLPEAGKKEVIATDILIDKFLRDAPRISRPRKEFFNPVNLAARSVEENEDFYTETYAAICLKQGNVSKAIKIYEKLSLKFPEKSSYFAGLIEKIKKEQNI